MLKKKIERIGYCTGEVEEMFQLFSNKVNEIIDFLNEQYTKQEEGVDIYESKTPRADSHKMLGAMLKSDEPASTPIVEECCGCYKLMPKDECRGECMCHTSNKNI